MSNSALQLQVASESDCLLGPDPRKARPFRPPPVGGVGLDAGLVREGLLLMGVSLIVARPWF
jgi:hypothetical protein